MKKFFSFIILIPLVVCGYTSTDVSNANYLATKGIITQQSTTAGFRLNDTITRAEAVGIALKIKGVSLPINYQCKNYFSDVSYNPNNNWICRAVELAADAGFVSRANTKFRPQDNITRAEALAIVMKAGGVNIKSGSGVSEGFGYFDENGKYAENWQLDVMETARLLGIIYPVKIDVPAKEYVPYGLAFRYYWKHNNPATRAEVFEFAKNIIEYQLTLSSTCTLDSPNFTCGPVTQGYENPDNPPPQVCGCRPTCPDGEAVIVSQGSGFWPDGSAKGTFVCSAEYPA